MRITPELLQKYHQGLCSEDEALAVTQWLAATDDLDQYAEQDEEDAATDEIWQKLDLGKANEPKNNRLAWLYPFLAAVAACLLLVASWNYFRQTLTSKDIAASTISRKTEYRYLQTATGERRRFLLPDSTVVYLNAGSRLTYPVGFSDTARTAWLTGEGYFEVAKDSTRPFTIHTVTTRTTVLGTAFNLKSYPGSSVTLVVSEGKVRFAPKGSGTSHLILTANERGIYDHANGRLAQDRVYAQGHFGWVRNRLTFDNLPLAEIAPVLERWYGVKVVITAPELASRRCTGSFADASLENVMNSVAYSLNIKYKIVNKKLTIYQ
ncbi:FecR family protein [Dyadobacter jiangsuensis]|uniref:FecR family protein n=1 Tax=Dyadobacter jiangsuensis TaxID=1591085 RepID=A0A2P8GJ44_9BACT|nr:FecR domain-containing protein [Dyadobacter jiangsuensis]PSL33985.1 FecR family protein [Dyadobacter jiangsuensis]